MKFLLLFGLTFCVSANFLDDVVQPLEKEVNAATYDIAYAMENDIAGILPVIGSTFADIWNEIKNSLEETGKEMLSHASNFAVDQYITSALKTAESLKRPGPDRAQTKAFVSEALLHEYQKWLADIRDDIMGSKDELEFTAKNVILQQMPQELQDYLLQYIAAKARGEEKLFVFKQADKATKMALETLEKRFKHRISQIYSKLATEH